MTFLYTKTVQQLKMKRINEESTKPNAGNQIMVYQAARSATQKLA